VIGALAGAVIVIAIRTIKDIPTAIIAATTIIILLGTKKIKEPSIILIAAVVGLILKLIN
jgi:chromate transporter